MRLSLITASLVVLLALPAAAQYTFEAQSLSKDVVVQGSAPSDPKSDATALTAPEDKPSLPTRSSLPPVTQDDPAHTVNRDNLPGYPQSGGAPSLFTPPDSITSTDTTDNNPKHNATGLGRHINQEPKQEPAPDNPAHQLDPAVKDIAGGSGNYTDEPECPEGQAALPLQGGWQCVKPDIECPEGKKPHRALGGWECVDR